MEKDQTCYLTTFDNPFNPDTQFSDWLDFDIDHGYYSCAYLDRIARLSPSMSDIEREREIERAIDEIIRYDFRNIYTKLYVKKQEYEENEIENNENNAEEDFDKLISRDNWKDNR